MIESGPEGGDGTEFSSNPLVSSSRRDRVDLVHRIPELLAQLRQEAESQVEEVVEAREFVLQLEAQLSAAGK
jgi:hypothetical protein